MKLLKFETVLILFETYKKLLDKQISLLKQFDVDAYLRLHPNRMKLSLEYQKTIDFLLSKDLNEFKIAPDVKKKILKTLSEILQALEVQKKLLYYAQKSQESLTEIYKDYAYKVSVTTYGSSGYQHSPRQSMVALSEKH